MIGCYVVVAIIAAFVACVGALGSVSAAREDDAAMVLAYSAAFAVGAVTIMFVLIAHIAAVLT